MPEITRFYGIIIKMFFLEKEHNPPHFHAVYGDYLGMFDIKDLTMLEGDLPYKAQILIKEWALKHKEELLEMWNNQEFKRIEPLE